MKEKRDETIILRLSKTEKNRILQNNTYVKERQQTC